MKDSSSQVPLPVAVTVNVYVVGINTFTFACPLIVIVFPTMGPRFTPNGRPIPEALVALPPKSNVIGVILFPSQIV